MLRSVALALYLSGSTGASPVDVGVRPIRLSDMKDKRWVFFSPPIAQIFLHVVAVAHEQQCAQESYRRTVCQLLSGSLHMCESPLLLPCYMCLPDVMVSLDGLMPHLLFLYISVSSYHQDDVKT